MNSFATEPLIDFIGRQSQPVWALIDGVSCKPLPDLAQRYPGECLYNAGVKSDTAHAPWLFRVQPDGPLAEELALLPADMHWGVLFTSVVSSERLRSHFRRFTMIWVDGREDLDNAPVYFRFYDPRVMLDCFDALLPAHLAALLQPVQRLAVPLSPLMSDACGVSPLAARGVFREKVLSTECPETAKGQGGASFRISGDEFQKFGLAQRQRAQRKLARELHLMHPMLPHDLVLYTARHAGERAGRYGLTSVQQVRLYADCMLWHGEHFDRQIPEARSVLMKDDPLAWRKASALEAWFNASKAGPPQKIPSSFTQ